MAFLSQLRSIHVRILPAFLFPVLLLLLYALSFISFTIIPHGERHAPGNSAAISDVEGPAPTVATGPKQQQQTTAQDPDDYPVKVIKEHLRLIRSWASSESASAPTCDGGGVFVYELPPKFNKDIVSWLRSDGDKNLRDYFRHGGLGLPIPDLGAGAYRTHQFSLEPIFHARALNHPCRVRDPAAAALFYVPFYGALHIMKSHMNHSTYEVKDALGMELVEWLEGQTWWRRRRGGDHMFVLGMITWDFRRHERETWGSNFLSLKQMSAPYRFLIERHVWDTKDIGVPYPSYFHPHGDADVARWQERVLRSKRKTLAAFAGTERQIDAKSFRPVLIRQCKSAGERCEFLECARRSQCKVASVVALMLRSEFCLQPPGDSATRKSTFDSLASGCIPVFFSALAAEYQYPWHLPERREKYSVVIEEKEVRKEGFDLLQRLREVSQERREEMRRFIVQELMPQLVYGDANATFEKFPDAFDITMNNIIHKIRTFGY